MNPNNRIADQNVERLLADAYRPETPEPAFVQRTVAAMLAEAQRRQAAARPRKKPLAQIVALAVAASLLIGVGLFLSWQLFDEPGGLTAQNTEEDRSAAPPVAPRKPVQLATTAIGPIGLTAHARKASVAPPGLAVGQSAETKAGERRRVGLPDGSILYLNADTAVKLDAPRHVTLTRGEVFVEVTPNRGAGFQPAGNEEDRKEEAGWQLAPQFVVATPDRQITALGTKFNVRHDDSGTGVMVTQGKVAISGLKLPLLAGQQLAAVAADEDEPAIVPAPRASYALDWTRDLMAAALSPLVPASKYAGGALVAKDPNGQESRLSLRRYHVDVYIEDGFARTTIDQTYFNHETSRLEGTFYFPLPPDASLSRLAMYVNGRLMEGGMAEREYARQVFESIVYRQKDPALLEWIDGSTFKMRVFPLEGRQEKRIVLSYTQKLTSLYGRTEYRFPGGHNMPSVDRWSAHLCVKKGAELKWTAQPQEYKVSKQDGDLLLDASAENIKPDRDVVLTLNENEQPAADGKARFASVVQDGSKYLMLRWRPDLPGEKRRERRDWVFLFEASADRDPLLARTQIDVIKTILENAEHDDTFAVVTAGTHAAAWKDAPRPATPENVQKALKFLEQTHLVGALDLERGLAAAAPLCKAGKNAHLVHVGSGVPVLGRRDIDVLVKLVPEGTRYVGVGVGKRWQRTLMKSAAARSGGFTTQINPDEQIAWRAFDLLATLNAPRMLNVSVVDAAEQVKFLCHNDALVQGEELCAIARVDKDKPLPEAVEVTGLVDGKLRRERLAVGDCPDFRPGENGTVPLRGKITDGAAYLPRTWAKLEIERLVAEGAEKNKPRIIELSKAMYVMSPFTSLLVLEDEQMYVQYKVDRGRKDHWAMYACPATIPVVHEPLSTSGGKLADGKKGKPTVEEVLHTLLVRTPAPAYGSWRYTPGQTGGTSLAGWQLMSLERARIDHSKNVVVGLTGATGEPGPAFSADLDIPYRNYGWGLYRRPELLLNETTAFHDRRVGNLDYGNGVLGNGRIIRWPGGGNFVMSDGGARFISDSIDIRLHQASGIIDGATVTSLDFDGDGQRKLPDGGFYYLPLTTLNGGTLDFSVFATEFGTERLPLNRLGTYTPDQLRLWEDIKKSPTGRLMLGVGVNSDLGLTGQLMLNEDNFDWTAGAMAAGALREQRVVTGAIRAEVVVANMVEQARAQMLTDPDSAAKTLKNAAEWVRQAPEMTPEVRNQLADAIHAGLREAARYAEDTARRQQALAERPASERERVQAMVDTFNRLMDEQRFAEAEVVANRAAELAPDSDAIRIMTWQSKFVRRFRTNESLRAGNEESAWSVFDAVEMSAVPFDDSSPYREGDLRRWEELTKSRIGSLGGQRRPRSEREMEVLRKLRTPVSFTFTDTPLNKVLTYLAKTGDVELRLHAQGLAQEGVTADTPVTLRLSNEIMLKSALNLILEPLHLTYVIENGVVTVTSEQAVERVSADEQWPRAAISARSGMIAELLYVEQFAAFAQPPAYETPRFSDDWGAFADLTAYAPGLHTSAADVCAAVEAETEPHPAAKPGRIDKQARRLIETARAAGWQTATIELVGRVSNSSPPLKPQASSLTPLTVDFDGTGRFRFERTTAAGLREQVICDGANLWHLYPELGLAGRRAMSRFHRGLLGQAIPWALPPAEDMARGADLATVDENTVAVVPHGLEHWKDKAGKPLPYVRLHLVFADNRLAERRLVEMPAGKVLLRQTYGADGMVRVMAGEDQKAAGKVEAKEAAKDVAKKAPTPIEWKIALKPCGAPSLTPDVTKVVVLPLPVRSRASLEESRNLAQSAPCENWSQDDALSVVAACLYADQNEAQHVLARRFFDRGDRRLGLYVLLAASGFTWDTGKEVSLAERPPVRLNPTADHPREPAARYLVGYLKARQAGDGDLGWVRGPKSGLLQQLTEFGLLRARWKNGKANEANEANRKDTQQRTLDFIANCPMPQFGWTLLTAALKENKDAAFQRKLAEAALRFEDMPALRYAARYERAAGLARAAELAKRDRGAAQEAFRTLYTDALKYGFLPPVDERFRAAFQTGEEGNRQWQAFLRDSAQKLIARHARPAAVRLAWQVRQVGDPSLAEELFLLATAAVPEKEELPTVLAAVAYLTQNGQQPRADAMLQPLLDKLLADEDYARWPGLWRLMAAVAERRGQAARSLQCTERAMDLEYRSLPEQVNVQTIRTQYGQLLGRYQQVAAALATVGSKPPADFLGRVVQAADRWRALDTDPTAACQAAARIFTDLGAADLAWDYLTTPLAARPNEAAPWVSLAESLRQQSQFELADRAYASAFEAEPTNARILWDRAQVLQQTGRAAEARQLLRQISEGDWQPAFDGIKSQAREAVGY